MNEILNGRPVRTNETRGSGKSIGKALLMTFGKGFSFVLYLVVRFILRYRFQVLWDNLRTSFPRKSKADLTLIVNKYYKHLADLVVEPIIFALASSSARKQLATYTNKELLYQYAAENRHAVLLASHIGNWEYLINLPQEISYKVYTAYTPISNHTIDNWVHKMRSMLGVTVIMKNQFYKKALMALKGRGAPALVVVIGDQRPAPGSVKYNVEFMGQNTSVQIGAERLAMSSNAAVLYLQCTRKKQFHYEYTFHLVTESPAKCNPLEITEEYYKLMERDITSQPGSWLWTHKRWKPVS